VSRTRLNKYVSLSFIESFIGGQLEDWLHLATSFILALHTLRIPLIIMVSVRQSLLYNTAGETGKNKISKNIMIALCNISCTFNAANHPPISLTHYFDQTFLLQLPDNLLEIRCADFDSTLTLELLEGI